MNSSLGSENKCNPNYTLHCIFSVQGKLIDWKMALWNWKCKLSFHYKIFFWKKSLKIGWKHLKREKKKKRKKHFWRQKKLKKPSRDEFLFLAFWQPPATTHVNNYFWQGRQDTQHNGTQHFDIQHNNKLNVTLSPTTFSLMAFHTKYCYPNVKYWVALFRMPLWWMSLCRVQWRPGYVSFLYLQL